MKYVLAGIAVVAAVAALFFRPPQAVVTPPPRSFALDSAGRGPAGAAADRAGGVDEPAETGRTGGPRSRRLGRPTPAELVVYVAGDVSRPGVYHFAAGMRAADALARAGGPKPDADLVAVNLAAPLEDGAEIAVPKIGESTVGSRRASGAHKRATHSVRGHRRGRPSEPTLEPRSVDLNSAGESELETLPGIGPALAERIVAYRESNGPFAAVDELADISGMTPRIQEEIADFVIVR
jgi:competence protein ComEA